MNFNKPAQLHKLHKYVSTFVYWWSKDGFSWKKFRLTSKPIKQKCCKTSVFWRLNNRLQVKLPLKFTVLGRVFEYIAIDVDFGIFISCNGRSGLHQMGYEMVVYLLINIQLKSAIHDLFIRNTPAEKLLTLGV